MRALFRHLREDRALAIVTVLMALAACAPLAVTPLVPFVDLPTNVGAASLLGEAAFGHGLAAKHYAVNWNRLEMEQHGFVSSMPGILKPDPGR